MIRRFLRRRPTGWFAIAAVLAAIAGIATLRAASTSTPTTTVVVAATDLAVGTRLDGPEQVAITVPIPVGGALRGMVRSMDELHGRIVAVPVASGEPLTQAALGGMPGVGPPPLGPGERAVSVPLAAAGAAAALLVPGVRVDIVASSPDETRPARVVVAAAEVIVQTAAPGSDGGALDGGAVLLRVGEREALRLTAALDLARGVRLLPRPASDLVEGIAP